MTGPTLHTLVLLSSGLSGIVSFVSWRLYRTPGSLAGVLASLAIVVLALPASVAPNVTWIRTAAFVLSISLSVAAFVVIIRQSRQRARPAP
jgi:hypothetical protein